MQGCQEAAGPAREADIAGAVPGFLLGSPFSCLASLSALGTLCPKIGDEKPLSGEKDQPQCP